MYRECEIKEGMPIQRQMAAEAVIHYFKREDDIIGLFVSMLKHENK